MARLPACTIRILGLFRPTTFCMMSKNIGYFFLLMNIVPHIFQLVGHNYDIFAKNFYFEKLHKPPVFSLIFNTFELAAIKNREKKRKPAKKFL
jgi:hypothetical protein